MLARLIRRPELGALSGAILIYVIFYALAGSSGMFTLEGIINILQVSAEIGILATIYPAWSAARLRPVEGLREGNR